MHQGVKTETITYPGGGRRESTTYPNGVRKDYLYYPDGQMRHFTSFQNVNNVGYSVTGWTAEQKLADDPKADPYSKRPSIGFTAPMALANPRRKSVVDYVAPPIKRSIPNDRMVDLEIPKCCFCLNIRIGAVIIGIIELGLLGVALYGVSHWYIDTADDPEPSNDGTGRRARFPISRNGLLGGCVVVIILVVFVVLSLFYGLWKKKTSLIVPHLVIQGFAILGAIVGIVLGSIAVAIINKKNSGTTEDDLSDKDSLETYYFFVGILVFSIFVFFLEIYGFILVRNCARVYNVYVPEVDGEEMTKNAADKF